MPIPRNRAENTKNITHLTGWPRVILIQAGRSLTTCGLDSMKRKATQNFQWNGIRVCTIGTPPWFVQYQTEMEDLSMKYLEPDTYKEIARKLQRNETQPLYQWVYQAHQRKMERTGFTPNFEIYGRPKSIPLFPTRSKRKDWVLKKYTICSLFVSLWMRRPNVKRKSAGKLFHYHGYVYAQPGTVCVTGSVILKVMDTKPYIPL